MRASIPLLAASLLAAACNPMDPLVRQLLATPTTLAAASPTPAATRPAGSPSATLQTATAVRATPTAASVPTSTPTRAASPTPEGIVTVQNPESLLALVTKRRQLAASYVPEALTVINGTVRATGEQRVRGAIVDPLRRMTAEMAAAGLAPSVVSAYRSFQTQEQTFAYWVRTLGLAQAERVSARPGHSEHQLGLAVDFGSPATNFELEQTFAGTPEGRWLAANARRFGFIMSYPSGKEALTGYDYEPWHFRYVGLPESQQIADRGLTLEEFLSGR